MHMPPGRFDGIEQRGEWPYHMKEVSGDQE